MSTLEPSNIKLQICIRNTTNDVVTNVVGCSKRNIKLRFIVFCVIIKVYKQNTKKS